MPGWWLTMRRAKAGWVRKRTYRSCRLQSTQSIRDLLCTSSPLLSKVRTCLSYFFCIFNPYLQQKPRIAASPLPPASANAGKQKQRACVQHQKSIGALRGQQRNVRPFCLSCVSDCGRVLVELELSSSDMTMLRENASLLSDNLS